MPIQARMKIQTARRYNRVSLLLAMTALLSLDCVVHHGSVIRCVNTRTRISTKMEKKGKSSERGGRQIISIAKKKSCQCHHWKSWAIIHDLGIISVLLPFQCADKRIVLT
jgi:hypothetical protein